MKRLLFVILSSAIILTLVNCKRENNNRCDTAHPLSAGFLMQEDPQDPMFSNIELYDVDTAGNLGVRFTALEPKTEGVTYSWRIGNDTRRWTTQSVYLLFADFYSKGGRDIDVWLTVRKPVDNCFPGDTVKTSMRTLHFDAGTRVKGYFEGYFSNDLSTKKTIYVNPDTAIIINGFQYNGPYIEGLPVYSPLSPVDTEFERVTRLRMVNMKTGPTSSSTGEKGFYWMNLSLEKDNQNLHISFEALDRPYDQWKVGDPIIKKTYSFNGKRVQ